MAFLLILISLISSSFALVEKGVNKPEVLFVNQHTPVWCWAAMSEGVRKFYKFPHLSQEQIVDANPFRDTRDINGYQGPGTRLDYPEDPDYLLDEVLSNEKYQAHFERFSNRKVLALLDRGEPVILSYSGHVTVIYAYIVIRGETFYKMYDPAAWLFNQEAIKLFSQYYYENHFGEPQAYIVYLKKRS